MTRRGEGRTRQAVASGFAAAFVALAVWIEVAGSVPGDKRALVELNETIGTDVDDAMVAIGRASDIIPLAISATVALLLLVGARRRRDAWLFAIGVGVIWAVNPLLKELVARPRPDVRSSPEVVSMFSFPSGHAANSAALIGGLFLVAPTGTRRPAVVAAGGALLIAVGFSRLAIGVHYPSDIVGAWLWVGAWIALLSSSTSGAGEPD